jgi:hypothetical protein
MAQNVVGEIGIGRLSADLPFSLTVGVAVREPTLTVEKTWEVKQPEGADFAP